MQVSLILATRDRAGPLARSIRAVAGLDLPPGWTAELIVVDNGSTDGTPALLAGLPDPLAEGIRLRPLREPRPGKSRAQNLGMEAAAGEVLAFLDDDVLLDPGWAHGLAEGLAQGGEALQGGVRLLLPEPRPWWISPRVEAIMASTLLWTDATPVTALIGSNMAVARGEGLPRFHEGIGPGTPFAMGEDTEWSGRALATRRGLFCPPMSATHQVEERVTVGEIVRRLWWGGIHDLVFTPPERRLGVALRSLARVPRELLRGLFHLVWGRPLQALDAGWTLCRLAGQLSAGLGAARRHPLWRPDRPLR